MFFSVTPAQAGAHEAQAVGTDAPAWAILWVMGPGLRRGDNR